MNPSSSGHHAKSSKNLRMQQNEKKSDFEDFEFASGLLPQGSTSSTYRAAASHSASQRLSKNKLSGHSTLKQTPSINDPAAIQSREPAAAGPHKCPHCPKTFSKRFSIQKHVQVWFLRVPYAPYTSARCTTQHFRWHLADTEYERRYLHHTGPFMLHLSENWSEYMIALVSYIAILVHSSAFPSRKWTITNAKRIGRARIVIVFSFSWKGILQPVKDEIESSCLQRLIF